MKTIFITISRGALIRNFFHTGVISKILDKNIRVIILTPHYNEPTLFKDYKHKNLFFEPSTNPLKIKFRRIFQELFKGAMFNKTIHSTYKYRFDGKKLPSRIYYIPRILFFAPLKKIPYFKAFIRWVDFKINPETEYDYLFNKYKPDLVFTTTVGNYDESGPIKSAKRFKVKTVCIPKSWDNPSFQLFNVKTDYIFVWSKFVKEQAIKFQGYKDNEVIITGVPQFDYYANKNNLMSRNDFCNIFRLDPDKKIILYGSSGVRTDYEPDFMELIKHFIDNKELQDIQVLIRPHVGYPGDNTQYRYLEKYQEFILDKSSKEDSKFKDYWDVSEDHLKILFNSLYHADVLVNIASTLTLDATACGTPVINIGFDVNKNLNKHYSVKRFYTLDYVQAVTGTGATWLVSSQEEFLQALKDILEDRPEKKEKEAKREEFIDYFMHKNDGESAQRIADNLVRIANLRGSNADLLRG